MAPNAAVLAVMALLALGASWRTAEGVIPTWKPPAVQDWQEMVIMQVMTDRFDRNQGSDTERCGNLQAYCGGQYAVRQRTAVLQGRHCGAALGKGGAQ